MEEVGDTNDESMEIETGNMERQNNGVLTNLHAMLQQIRKINRLAALEHNEVPARQEGATPAQQPGTTQNQGPQAVQMEELLMVA